MGVYEVTTENGVYRITTEDAATPMPQAPAPADQLNGVTPSFLEKASSGVISGLGGMSDLAQMVTNPGAAIAQNLFGKETPGQKLNREVSSFTGVPDAANVAPDSYAHNFGEYLPSTIIGGGGVGGLSALNPMNALKTAGSAARTLGLNALTAGGGYAGKEVGGPLGEVIGAVGATVAPGMIANGVSKVAGQAADDFERMALNVQRADLNKAAKNVFKGSAEETPLVQSLETARGMGIFKGSKSAPAMIERNEAAIDDLSEKATDILTRATKAQTDVVAPEFANTKTFLAENSVDAKTLGAQYEDRVNWIAKEWDGTLESLQKLKTKLYKKAYPVGSTESAALDRVIARDLKESIEAGAAKYLSPGEAANLKGLNATQGKLITLRDLFDKNKKLDEMPGGIAKALRRVIVSPLGGGATGLIASLATGNPLPLIAGAAGGVATTKTGQFALSGTSRAIANILKSEGVSANALRSALPAIADSSGGKLSDIPAPTSEKKTDSGPTKTSKLFESVLMDKKAVKPSSPTLVSAKKVGGENVALVSHDEDAALELGVRNYMKGGMSEATAKTKTWKELMERRGTPGVPEPARVETKSPKIQKVEAMIDADPVDAAIYQIESGRNPLAKNPVSTASGAFQLLKGTAKALGVQDPFDIEQNYSGYKKLRAENEARFGSDPELLYSAHYLGAPVLDKYLKGKKLSENEQKQVDYLETKVLPRFREVYKTVLARAQTEDNGTA